VWLNVSVVAQLVVVAVLCLAVLVLARQVGILHRRLTPAGAGLNDEPPLGPGDLLAPQTLNSFSGEALVLDSGAVLGTLLLFVSPDCPVCRSLLPVCQRFVDQGADGWQVRWLFPDPGGDELAGYVERHGMDERATAIAPELARRLGIEALPALVVLDRDLRLLRREVLAGPRQLETLFAGLAADVLGRHA